MNTKEYYAYESRNDSDRYIFHAFNNEAMRDKWVANAAKAKKVLAANEPSIKKLSRKALKNSALWEKLNKEDPVSARTRLVKHTYTDISKTESD